MALKEKRKKTDKYSQQFLENIKLRDFMGNLTPDEVEIAREVGLLRWDLWGKARRTVDFKEYFEDGKAVAPVFDGYGKIDAKYIYGPKRYVINNYNELAKYLANNHE